MKFCRKYGNLSSDFKDCGEVELADKTVVDYLGFCREVFSIVCMSVIFIIIKHLGSSGVGEVFNIRLFKI